MLCFQISICKYLVEQELPTLPEYMSLLSSFYGVRVAQSLVFCRAYFVFLFFFVWSLFCLSMYCFWLPLWYLKNLLTNVIEEIKIAGYRHLCVLVIIHQHFTATHDIKLHNVERDNGMNCMYLSNKMIARMIL